VIRACFLIFSCIMLDVGGAFGQHEHAGDGEAIGWVPREILERPVSLREGIGKISDPVTTPSQEAQAFYNQGVAYLHSYVWIEAARSCKLTRRLSTRPSRNIRTTANSGCCEVMPKNQMPPVAASVDSLEPLPTTKLYSQYLPAISLPSTT